MWGISVRPAARSRPCPEALPQCIVTRRSAPPSHGEKFHRRTIVTRSTAPPSHGIHPYIHPYVMSPQVFGPCPLLLLAARYYIVTRPRTISSHGCGQYRHMLRKHIATRHALYRHTVTHYIVTWCKTISFLFAAKPPYFPARRQPQPSGKNLRTRFKLLGDKI